MQSLRLPLFHFLHRTTSPLNPTRPFFQIHLHTRSQVSSNHHPTQTTQPIKNDTVTHEFRFFSVYESGWVEKFHQTHKIPGNSPSSSTSTTTASPSNPHSPHIHNYVRTLSSEADVIAILVDYRLAPEHPIPACYDDSWVADHCKGNGPEPWLNDYAYFDRVFVSRGNISHDLVVPVVSLALPEVKLVGAVLVHPYFGGTDDDAMWLYMFRDNNGLQDKRLRLSVEDLRRHGCERVLVFVVEKDHLNGVGKNYVEELKKSGWKE